MVTISVDGPRPLHDGLRGMAGGWDRAIDAYRRLRDPPFNFQAVVRMSLVPKNADAVDAHHRGDPNGAADFTRASCT